jgi:hypothetical protein
MTRPRQPLIVVGIVAAGILCGVAGVMESTQAPAASRHVTARAWARPLADLEPAMAQLLDSAGRLAREGDPRLRAEVERDLGRFERTQAPLPTFVAGAARHEERALLETLRHLTPRIALVAREILALRDPRAEGALKAARLDALGRKAVVALTQLRQSGILTAPDPAIRAAREETAIVPEAVVLLFLTAASAMVIAVTSRARRRP